MEELSTAEAIVDWLLSRAEGGAAPLLQQYPEAQKLSIGLRASHSLLLTSHNLLQGMPTLSVHDLRPSFISLLMQTRQPKLAAASGATRAHWADVAGAAAEQPSCRLFLGVPLVAADGTPFGALLLGVAGTTLTREVLRLGLQLAAVLGQRHHAVLQGHAEEVARLLLRPWQRPPQFGPADDDVEDKAGSDSASDADGSSGRVPGAQELGTEEHGLVGQSSGTGCWCLVDPWQPWASGIGSRLFLHFPDWQQEQRFLFWLSQCMAKWDAVAYALDAVFALLTFQLPHISLASNLSLGMQLRAWLPLLAGILSITLARDWYVRHRHRLTLVFLWNMLLWMLQVRNYMGILTPAEFRRNCIHANGYTWLTFSPIMHPLPFRTLAATLPVLAAASLSLMPAICTTIYPEQQLEACVAGGVMKVVVRGLVLPLLVVYVAELLARRVFLASPGEAAAAAAAAPAEEAG